MFCVLFILLQIVAANYMTVPRVALIVAGVCALAEMAKKFLMFCDKLDMYSKK